MFLLHVLRKGLTVLTYFGVKKAKNDLASFTDFTLKDQKQKMPN